MNSVKLKLLFVYTMFVMCEAQCPANIILNPPEAHRVYQQNNTLVPGYHLINSMLDSSAAFCFRGTHQANLHWMTMDLQTPMMVMGVVMQGRGDDASQYVTRINIASSNDGVTYASHGEYTTSGLETRHAKSNLLLNAAVSTRYLKITIVSWVNIVCLRIAVILP